MKKHPSGVLQALRPALLWALVVMVIGLGLSVAGFWELQQITKERLYLETEKTVRNKLAQIQTNINISLDSLTNLARLYDVAGDISSEQLAQFYNSDTRYHAGTVGLAWIPKVRQAEITAFEDKARASGISDFKVYEITGHGLPRAVNSQQLYYPVRAVYPTVGTDLKPGLNMAAVASRRLVMDKALRAGKTVITDRVSIFRNTEHLYGFQAFQPVYADNDIVGFAVGLYDFAGLFADAFSQQEAGLTVYDSGSSSQQLLFSNSPGFSTVNEVRNTTQLQWNFPLRVANKQWLVSVFPSLTKQHANLGWVPYLGLISGSLITTLLTLYLAISLVRARQVNELSFSLAGTTSQLELQRQLKDEADKANQAKSRMFRAASHDLRQPLHTIGLLSGLLKDSREPEQIQALSAKLANAADNMSQMFSALLDISLLESGKQKVVRCDFAVYPMLEKIYFDYEETAKLRGNALRLSYSTAAVHSDPVLVERILRNLLSNAIRYTQKGKVLMGCRRRGDYLRLMVVDNGIGMTAEAQQHIAEEFFRDDAARKLSDNGLGLGLSIVTRTAAVLGITFDFESHHGQGSCFYIDLPLSGSLPASSIQKPDVIYIDQLKQRVCLIEDDKASREALQQTLESWGCLCEVFANGEQLAAWLVNQPRQPDVILADYQLVGETGLQWVRHIRKHFAVAIPVLMITAATDVEAEISTDDQPLDIMLKPVDWQKLYYWLSKKSG